MLIWLDLETTGLDAHMDNILEVGLCFTDNYGKQVSLDRHFPELAGWTIRGSIFSTVVPQPEEPLALMDDFVRDMHTKNGLLEEIRKHQCDSYIDSSDKLSDDILSIMKTMGCEKQTTCFAGNSVHFYASFLKAQLSPAIFDMVSHRILDMSSVAIFAESLDIPRPPKKQCHRVTEDIQESLGYFEYYRKCF